MKAELQQGAAETGALNDFLDELVGRDRPIRRRRKSSARARDESDQTLRQRKRRAAPAAYAKKRADLLDAFLNELVGHSRHAMQRRGSSARI